MKKSRKGFTLVELLVTIILLGVVGAVVIYNMTSVNSTSKETEYERFVSAVKSAAAVYADMNPEAFKTLYESKAFIYFTAGDLITRGLLDEKLENPYTEKKIGTDELIKANLDSSSGNLAFEYPVENNDEESFLVAISDYVVWGEPYDCMTGAGTYRLALSDEKGNLILLNDEETIKKYNLSCSLPEEFKDTYDEETAKYLGKATKNAGSYEVTYNWVTESGTKKSATRTLKVLAKVTPDIYVYDANGKQYDYTKTEKFVPTVDETCTKWNTLRYKPMLSGADTSNTEYKIIQQSVYPKTGVEEVVTEYTKDFTKEYQIQNGIYRYVVSTIVHGHHAKDYSYVATSEDEGGKHIEITQELVTPKCLISGDSTTWTLDKTFSIKDSYAPNIVKYQYALREEGAENVSDLSPKERNKTMSDFEAFDRKGSVTVQNISLRQSQCADSGKRSIKIFFRAVNSNGYVGSWSPLVNAYLTNEVSTLITSDRGTNCNNSCTNVSSLGANSFYTGKTSLNGLSCYYCNKDVYISWGGELFNVLGLYGNGNDMLLANDAMIDEKRYSLTSIKPGVWNISTCDGLYGVSYYYSAPATKVLYETLADYVYDFGIATGNFEKKLIRQNWYIAVGAADYRTMPSQPAYKNSTAAAQWNNWNKAVSSRSQVKETFVAGIPTIEQYTQVFKNAIHPQGSYYYWLGGTQGDRIPIQVSHGDKTTVPTTHFYIAKNAGTQLFPTSSTSQVIDTHYLCYYKYRNDRRCETFYEYAGSPAYIKAMFRVQEVHACTGTGTKDDPYVVSVN